MNGLNPIDKVLLRINLNSKSKIPKHRYTICVLLTNERKQTIADIFWPKYTYYS